MRRLFFAGLCLALFQAPAPARAQTTCNGGISVSGPSHGQSQPFSAGGGATCANNTANFNIQSTISVQDTATGSAYGLNFHSAGVNGRADETGGAGAPSGFLDAVNAGSITISGTQTLPTVGLLLTTTGGNGGNATSSGNFGGAGGSDGGGISTGFATTNSGAIRLSGTFAGGATGFLLQSQGGNGGFGYSSSDDGIDGGGGPGGSGNGVSVVNTGAITIGTNDAFAAGGVSATGLGLTSRAGIPGGVNTAPSGTLPNAQANGNGQAGQGGVSGAGGSAGLISVTNTAPIAVYWSDSGNTMSVFGIQALSQGGTGIILQSGNDGHGNTGGNGGSSGTITVTQTGNITLRTSNLNASATGAAIGAFSLGGAGGPSGDSSTTSGAGGPANAVNVSLVSGALSTQGTGLAGIRAASRGGTGASGITNTSESSHNINGGAGAASGAVTVTLQAGSIATNGTLAFGIGAISAGGAGGAGNDFDDLFGTTTGSNGGDGGAAGSVTVTVPAASSITTSGTQAVAIAAQSVGGPGGAAGAITKVLEATAGDPGTPGTVSTVTVTNRGTITTSGTSAFGILGQSIAASGGAGGSASGLVFAQGGPGAPGGPGNAVSITHSGGITTTGAAATGILAQSIGGGGGAAGSGDNALVGLGGSTAGGGVVANGGTVTVTNTGSISTAGGPNPSPGQPSAGTTSYSDSAFRSDYAAAFANAAVGILAQSVGGGGGAGGAAEGVITVGGSGAAGSNGGVVTVNNAGTITTAGQQSHAILAQSIGGGGGNAGNALSVSPSIVAVAVGGNAGVGGGGGNVTVNQTGGTITTTGPLAAGIIAQSVAGGGGVGGAGSAYVIGSPIFAVAVGVGGTGGQGGAGGTAQVNVANTTISAGNPYSSPPTSPSGTPNNLMPVDSYGVLVQSIGGGGGKGGASVAEALALAVPMPSPVDGAYAQSVSVSVGGSGGVGGAGGDAEVMIGPKTAIKTQGQGAHGIVAQSVGGGGGDGGTSSALAATIGYGRAGTAQGTQVVSIDVSVGVGGSGGATGNGALASVITQPAAAGQGLAITTYGDFADGILAQSVGGGGGNGGTGSGTTQNWGTTLNLSVGVGVGGTGSAGGDGGKAYALLAAGNTVRTYGSSAQGIVVQSIGAGGGNSQGVQVTAGLSAQFARNPDSNFIFAKPGVNANPGFNFAVNVGENGAGGGDGGEARGIIAGSITTSGDGGFGALVQSIGGGGGQGGSFGSDASADNPVLPVLNSVRAFITNIATLNIKMGGNFGIAVGGSGGEGGNGGQALAELSGAITTGGDWAMGLITQSIGGGGGVGGGAQLKGGPALLRGSTFVGSGVLFNRDLDVTGSPGKGGTGGSVLLLPDKGTVTTTGYGAIGVLGQSIGGGGGLAVNGSDFTDTPDGEVSSSTIAVGSHDGGAGGQPGDGGTVSLPKTFPNGTGGQITSSITVTTAWQAAHGLVLQSVGGGGGIGSGGNGDTGTSGAFNLTVGGGSSSNGGGGAVSADSLFTIATKGQSAFGILLQSIGGGGGIGFAPSIAATTGVDVGGRSTQTSAPTGSICGSGSNATPQANCGGPVTLVMESGSSITTAGGGAHAIVAQSIGGGGGIANFSPGDKPLQIAGPTSGFNAVGNGQAVSITTAGTVRTTGPGAFGILAQSVGGGGGLGDGGSPIAGSSGSNKANHVVGGAVTIVQNGTIEAKGANAVGIFAQSTSPGHGLSNGVANGDGIITVTVNGSVTGGSGANAVSGAVSVGGAGIWIDGGDNSNSITINPGGSVTAAGLAIGTSGNYRTTITNSGTITGSVNGAVRPTLNNLTSGVLNSGTELAADVTNQGLLVVAGLGSFGITTVRGDLAQTATGRLVFDADFVSQTGDALIVTGAATLAGNIRIVPRSVLPDRRIGLISLNGPVISQALEAERSSLFSYSLTQTGSLVSVEATGADFAPAGMGLSAAQSAVATGLQSVWDAGGNATFGQIFAGLAAAADAGGSAYPRALDQLSPGATLALGARQSGEAHAFTNALLSCPDFAGTTAHVVETNCTWIRMIGRHTVNDGGGGVRGSTLNTMTWQIGGQQAIAPDLFLAGSLAFQTGWIGGNDSVVTGSGQSGFGGLALKWQPGSWLVAASVMGSYGSYRMSRVVALPGLGGVAKSNPDQSSVAGRLRVAYNVWDDAWYLRPMVSLDIVHARAPGYQESGPAAVSLAYATASQTGVIATPAIEVGRRFDLGEGTTLRAYASLGMSFLSNPSWQVRTAFLGAPPGSGSFTTNLPGDRVLGRVTVGSQLLTADAFDLRAQYDGDYGGSMRSHAGTLTLAWRF